MGISCREEFETKLSSSGAAFTITMPTVIITNTGSGGRAGIPLLAGTKAIKGFRARNGKGEDDYAATLLALEELAANQSSRYRVTDGIRTTSRTPTKDRSIAA